jgi:hypothetical protein
LYAGNEEIESTVARTELDVAPGQSQRFENGAVAGPGVASGTLPCVDERAAAPPRARGRGDPSRIECVFRLTGTRGEEAFF